MRFANATTRKPSTMPGGSRPLPWQNIYPVTNKHPASTMAAHHLLGSEGFRRDLRADIRRWTEGVMAVPLPVDLAWMEAPRDQLAALLTDAARS